MKNKEESELQLWKGVLAGLLSEGEASNNLKIFDKYLIDLFGGVEHQQFEKLYKQLKQVASITGLPAENIYGESCANISSLAYATLRDLPEIIEQEISLCKRTIIIYKKMIETDIFNPEENDNIKNVQIHYNDKRYTYFPPLILYRIANELAAYPSLRYWDELPKVKREFDHELKQLQKLKEQYRGGKYSEIKQEINSKIGLCEETLEIIKSYWTNTSQRSETSSKYGFIPSATRPKNFSLDHMLEHLMLLLTENSNLQLNRAAVLISELLDDLRDTKGLDLPQISEEAILKNLSRMKDRGSKGYRTDLMKSRDITLGLLKQAKSSIEEFVVNVIGSSADPSTELLFILLAFFLIKQDQTESLRDRNMRDIIREAEQHQFKNFFVFIVLYKGLTNRDEGRTYLL
jgi:hypothetical protein